MIYAVVLFPLLCAALWGVWREHVRIRDEAKDTNRYAIERKE